MPRNAAPRRHSRGRAVGRIAATLTVLVLIAPLLLAPPIAAAAGDATCPDCGAPLEPGAAFCISCGRRVEAPVPAATGGRPAPRASVVQVIAGHDREMTSTLGAILYGSKLEVDSLLGSAFALAPGEFITDAGLLIGARRVDLRTGDGRTAVARVVGIDPMIGVGLLAADLSGIDTLPRRDNLPRPGESLQAIGFPSARRASAEPTATPGVVSALHRSGIGFHPVEDYIQIDASRPDGFAGGPVVDAQGRLVAMSTAGTAGGYQVQALSAGISVSIPTGWIDRALAWIRAGSPPRPWMGAYTAPADAERRSLFSLSPEARRVVTFVFPDSPAAAAGLKSGDGLVRFQGESIEGLIALQDRLLRAAPGDRIELTTSRGTAMREVQVTLAPRPQRPRLAGLDVLRFYGGFESEERDGGAITVTRVFPNSPASAAKVATGDVLHSILIKKDLEHAERANARWRAVRTLPDLEERLQSGFSEFDFFAVLRLRGRDGSKRELMLGGILAADDTL